MSDLAGRGDPKIPLDLREAIWALTNLYLDEHVSSAPHQHGLLGWTFDPAVPSANTTTPTDGVEHLIRVIPQRSEAVRSVLLHVASAGVTLTANQNWAGLRSASGLLLAKTADQSTNWASTGSKVMALDAPVPVQAGQPYYVVFVANGTTKPLFVRGLNSTLVNVGLATGRGRYMTNGSGLTDLPAQITMTDAAFYTFATWAGII